MIKRCWGLICLLFIFCFALSKAEAPEKTTVMVYMTGSDLESGSGAATSDIIEMMHSGLNTDEVNVLLFTGGSANWKSGFPQDRTGLYVIDKNSLPTEIELFDLMNMGDPQTLAFFLRLGRERYPAEQYMLILWDHGAGPLQGVCVDRLFNDDCLTLQEIDFALRESRIAEEKKLSLIGFDACLMSSLEAASVCEPYADYMVASQELEPGRGWNYAFLKGLESDSSAAETGRRIVDTYFDGASEEIQRGIPVTLTCMDLSKIAELKKSVDSLFADLSIQLQESNYAHFAKTRESSASSARATGREYDLVDLKDLLLHLDADESSDVSQVLKAFDASIVASRSSVDHYHGLSVYFPYHNKDSYITSWGDIYPSVSFGKGYAQWIREFGDILTGEELIKWGRIRTLASETDDSLFLAQLTPEQQDNCMSASLLVFEQDPIQRNSYFFVNQHQNVSLDSKGTLSAHLDDTSLFAVDAGGQPLSGALEYSEEDGFYTLRGVIWRDVLTYKDFGKAVILRIRHNPETDLLEIVDVRELGENFIGRNEVDISEWETIEIGLSSRTMKRDAFGKLLHYTEWENSEMLSLYRIQLSELHGFRFLPAETSGLKRFACFQIQDAQNNSFLSEFIPLDNPNTEEKAVSKIILDTPEARVTLDGLSIKKAEVDNGIEVTYTIENRLDFKVDYVVEHLAVNGSALSVHNINGMADPGDHARSGLTISFDEMCNSRQDYVENIAFDLLIIPRDNSLGTISLPISFDTDRIDLSGIVSLPEKVIVGAEESNGLYMEVFDDPVQQEDKLSLPVHLINHTGRTLTGECASCSVEDCLFQKASLDEIWCRDGEEWYGYLNIYANNPFIQSDDLWLDLNNFDAYEISSVSRFSLLIDGIPFSIQLDKPVILRRTQNSPFLPLSDVPSCTDDVCTIRLMGITAKEDQLLLHILLQNHSGQALSFDLWQPDGKAFGMDGEHRDVYCSGNITDQNIPGGSTVKMTIVLRSSNGSPLLPISEIKTQLSFRRGGSDKPDCFLIQDIILDNPVSEPVLLTSGYDFKQISAQETSGRLFEETVSIKEFAGKKIGWAEALLTGDQAENLARVRMDLVQVDGSFLRVVSSQHAELLDGNRIGASFPAMLLHVQGIPGSVIHTFNQISDVIIEYDTSAVWLSARNVPSNYFVQQTISVQLLIEYDSGQDKAVVKKCEPANPDDQFPILQEDFMQIHIVPSVVPLPNQDSWPPISKMDPDMDKVFQEQKSAAVSDGPGILELRPITDDDHLQVLFSVENKDGTGYSLPLIPLPSMESGF